MNRILFAAAALSCLFAVELRAGTVQFFEGNFTDWGATGYGQGSSSISSPATGGNPNGYRFVAQSVDPGTDWVLAFADRPELTFNPLARPVTGIDVSADTKLFTANDALGVEAGLILLQDGSTFFLKPGILVTQGGWASRTLSNLGPSDFDAFTGFEFDASMHPNFSAGASPMTFGVYQQLNQRPDAGRSFSAGIDNLRITIHFTPEPSSLVMSSIALGLAGLIGVWRGRRAQARSPLAEPCR